MKVWGEKRPLVSESTVNRLEVLDQFEGAKLTRKHSADILELSERQVSRIRERYSKGGALGLEHKSKGNAPANKTSAEVINKLTGLLQGKYYGFNVTHACEQINQNDGIEVKYDILKNLSRKLGLTKTKIWMPSPTAEAIKEIFCYKYTRKIKNDHTIHWQNEIYLIQSSLEVSLVGRYADIRIYDNGLMKVFYGGRELVMEVAKNRSWSQLRQSPKTWSRTKVEGTSLYK